MHFFHDDPSIDDNSGTSYTDFCTLVNVLPISHLSPRKSSGDVLHIVHRGITSVLLKLMQ